MIYIICIHFMYSKTVVSNVQNCLLVIRECFQRFFVFDCSLPASFKKKSDNHAVFEVYFVFYGQYAFLKNAKIIFKILLFIFTEKLFRVFYQSRGCSQLFRSLHKPFKPVSRDTISRWIKSVLELAGIDNAIFKAHSTRVAAVSCCIVVPRPRDYLLTLS